MNIPESVLNFCQQNGLEAISTGGNLDYMILKQGDYTFAIADFADAGSPDDLDSLCRISLWKNEDVFDSKSAVFSDVTIACKAINDTDFRQELIEEFKSQ